MSDSSTWPVTVLILALGGEGGGVLADWLVDAATAAGLPVQATSVPGVAQRTGATSYYIECLPRPAANAGARDPVFCLSPTPGQIDLLVSSELLETARALERGMADPARTVLISSTSRFLTVAERMHPADGRYDATRIAKAARACARDAWLFDMAQASAQAGTVISAVMFGAIAASGVLPLSRAQCEAVIAASSRGAQASLRGFALGWAAIERERAATPVAAPPDRARGPIATDAGEGGCGIAERLVRGVPMPAVIAELAALGAARAADYQDARYADQYLRRLSRVVEAERARVGAGAGMTGAGFPVSTEVARRLARWMSLDDVIRVADLKSRPARFARIRRDVGAATHEPVIVRDFFKPRAEELAAVLPAALAGGVLAWSRRRGGRGGMPGRGLRLNAGSIAGWTALRLLAALRPMRRRATQFVAEQREIDAWLDRIVDALAHEPALARELAACAGLLRGYADTQRRGRAAFDAILAHVANAPPGRDLAEIAREVARARRAAEADPDGRAAFEALGLVAPPAVARPVHVRRRESADWTPRGSG